MAQTTAARPSEWNSPPAPGRPTSTSTLMPIATSAAPAIWVAVGRRRSTMHSRANDQTSVEAMTAWTRMTPPCDNAQACTSSASTAAVLPASQRGLRSSRRSSPTGPTCPCGTAEAACRCALLATAKSTAATSPPATGRAMEVVPAPFIGSRMPDAEAWHLVTWRQRSGVDGVAVHEVQGPHPRIPARRSDGSDAAAYLEEGVHGGS